MEIGNQTQNHKIDTNSELIYEDVNIWSILIFIKIIGSYTLWFPLPPSEVLWIISSSNYREEDIIIISELRVWLVPLNIFTPSSDFVWGCLFCGSFLLFMFQFLSLLYCRVCSLQPCCHLLGKSWPIGSLVCCVFLCIFLIIFPVGVLGQAWYLIVLIHDLSLTLYFYKYIQLPKWYYQHHFPNKHIF